MASNNDTNMLSIHLALIKIVKFGQEKQLNNSTFNVAQIDTFNLDI